MSGSNEDALADVLTDLARDLGAEGSRERVRAAIVAHMEDKDLLGDDVPSWLLDLLRAVREGTDSGWVDFDSDGDRTAVVAFLRDPPSALHADVRDDVESLTVVFEPAGREATVSWEGSCYRVSAIGRSWDEAVD